MLPANLGSVARASKNFGVRDVRLIEPAAAADEDSHRLASGANDVLEAMRRFPSLPLAVADFQAVVATSSLRGRGHAQPCSRSPNWPVSCKGWAGRASPSSSGPRRAA